ncbi:portal protein [Desulfohalovibrio reitneri]|uniref:portal protein n=1 Tax=Desulfohalovibrio reitneri TaxID=1307759 RepID=UPI000AD3A464|nr:portal protein [Desulfohalovibrio reitneri]
MASGKETLRLARDTARRLEDARRPWLEHAREVAEHVAPDKGCFPGQSGPGEKRMGRVIDSTATRAAQIMAAGLHGGLTSPARPWFRLSLSDPDLMERGPVRDWLAACENRLYAAYRRSGFYQAAHALYLELGVFGSACLLAESDPERSLRFTCLTFGEFAWSEGSSGMIDTVARRREVPVRVLAERYGRDRLSESARRLLDKDQGDERVEVVHLTMPREDSVRAPGKPFAAYAFEEGGGELLSEGGFDEFPYLCPRWDVTGSEEYGRGPGMTVLPDVKMLQEMAKGRLQAVHMGLRPPMRVPSKYARRLNLIPGGQNYVNPQQADGLAPLYETRVPLAEVSHVIEDVRAAIRAGFFNDLFLMISNVDRSGVTATEVMEKQAEKLLMLGPIVERLQSEMLDPLTTRVFRLLLRSGELPRPPAELAEYAKQGGRLKAEYVSTLAQAQKMAGSQSILSMLSMVGNVAGLAPDALDKIDFEQALDELARSTGVPASVVRPDEQVAAMRKEKAEAARAQAQAQAQAQAAETSVRQGKELVQAAKTLSEIDTDGDNALTRLTEVLT